MIDLAAVGYTVDTSALARGEAALNSFERANKDAAGAADRVAPAFQQASSHIRETSVEARNGTHNIANLASQFNDIGVMIAAGQSPLQLALQQGTQINQVFTSMGGGMTALKSMGAALASIISPLSIATIGIIALGTAGAQHLLSLVPKAKDVAESFKELEAAVKSLKAAQDDMGMSATAMMEKYGSASPAFRQILADMVAIENVKMEASFREATTAALQAAGAIGNASRSFRDIRDAFNFGNAVSASSREAIREIMNMSAALDQATDKNTRLKLAMDLRETLSQNTNGFQNMNAQATQLRNDLNNLIIQLTLSGAKTDEINARTMTHAQALQQYARTRIAADAEMNAAAGEIVDKYTRQAEMARAVAQYGSDSVEVQELQRAAASRTADELIRQSGATGAAAQAIRDAVMAVASADMAAALQRAAEKAEETRANIAKTRDEAIAATAAYNRQADASENILRYGADSVQAEADKRAEAMRVADEYIRQNGLVGDVAENHRIAAARAYDTGVAVDQATRSLQMAEAAARALASAIAAAAGFSLSLDNQIEVMSARIDAQRAGANAAIAGQVRSMQLQAEANRESQLAAGEAAHIAEWRYQQDMARIEQLGEMTAQEQELAKANRDNASAAKKGASEAEKASKKAAKEAERETKQLQDRAKALRASLSPQQAYIDGMAELLELQGLISQSEMAQAISDLNVEFANSLPIVGELADAWGDFVARGFTDFKGMMEDVLKTFQQYLAQMIATAAKNRIVMSMGFGNAAGGGGFLGNIMGAALGSGGFDPLSLALGAAGAPVGGVGFLGGLSGVYSGFMSGGLAGGVGASFAGIGAGLSAGGFAGITAALGAAMPMLAALGGIIAIGKKLFGRKLKDTGIEATFSMAEGIAASTYKFYKGGWFRSDKTKRETMGKEFTDPVGEAFMEIGNQVTDFAETLGLNAERLADLDFSFKFSTKGMSEEDIQKRFMEEMERYGDFLTKELIPNIDKFNKDGESSMETLARLSGSLVSVNEAFTDFGMRIYQVGVAGAAAAADFVDLFGGIEQFQAAANFYYENFFSLSERYENAQRRMGETLSELGIDTIPETEAQFRALVEQMRRTGDTEALAALMQLAPEFLAMLEAGRAIIEEGPNGSAVTNERLDLERRLLQAQGDTVALRRLELQALHPTNRALQRQIWQQEHANNVADQRADLERQLLQVQGNTAELRRLELEALYPANRALQQQIWHQEQLAARSNEREGLEKRLLELQGNTAELRQMELAALFPYNRALQQQIWALEHAARVQQERMPLETRLLELQGNTAEIRRRELQALLPVNRALQQQIWALEDAAAILEERRGLEQQLLQAQGNTAALRALQLAGLDASNRALQLQIWALEDAAEAAERAAEEADRLAAIQEERAGLESAYAQALGDTAWLRAKELEALDASNRALQRQIWAIEDAQAAYDAAKDAAKAATDAERERIDRLKSMSSEIRGMADSVLDATRDTSEAQRLSAERQLRVALETGKVWDDSLKGLADQAANVDSGNFQSYTDFMLASARAASLLRSVADAQEQEVLTAEQRLEAALEKYGLKEETVLGLSEALAGLDRAIIALAQAQREVPGVTPVGVVPPSLITSPAVLAQQASVVQQGNTDLVNEVRALRNEVVALRNDNNQGNAQIAKQAKMAADIQRRWEVDGMPVERA